MQYTVVTDERGRVFVAGAGFSDRNIARDAALAILRADLPEAWADLVEALVIAGRHPASDISPTHCEHDKLTVLGNVSTMSIGELARLKELHFEPDAYDGDMLASSWFGSA